MRAEPHKIKTIRKKNFTTLKERKNVLKSCQYNTFRISSDQVTFDMTSQGTGAMCQDQLSGLLIGDEAYAGSRNFESLERSVRKVLGHKYVCPTHNLRGSIKLISMTMVKEGNSIFSNSLTPRELTEERKAKLICIPKTQDNIFPGNLDMNILQREFPNQQKVPYIYVETFADGYLPFSLSHLKELRSFLGSHYIKMVLDASGIVENALYIKRNESAYKYKPLAEIVKDIIECSNVSIVDAGQDTRCNAGGLISTDDPDLHLIFQNEVVVYEGLHTYGGMAGRTMEIFARGLEEMIKEPQALWIEEQVRRFVSRLENIPFIPGCDGVYIKADEFLPDISKHQAHALAVALYLKSGVRAFLEGRFSDEKILPIQIPRLSLSNHQLSQIAQAINELYKERKKWTSLKLLNNPDWHDEATFEMELHDIKEYRFDCEPYVIHTIEHVGLTSKEERDQLIREAGYNTFLLDSKAITIDFLTDSGTSAMSMEQWEKYHRAVETPASSKDYHEFVKTVQECTGYKHIIPTHQGRAAEHILSQVMIEEEGIVPGNMYFTTTRLHQELAGGTFVDVIVDEAHNPTSTYEWKGDIDLNKLDDVVKEHGSESIPYISFETSVNMAGGQPVSMENAKKVYEYCQGKGIPIMFDATRIAENAYMIKKLDPKYNNVSIKDIVKEIFSYGDGCTMSSKKDCLVNIGGFLAFRDNETVYKKALDMLRKYEGTATNGGMTAGDMASQAQGIREVLSYEYIRSCVELTQYLGKRLLEAEIPIVEPPGTHAIFLDAKRFLPHIDQDEYPAQALAGAIFVECGVRAMERGNVSKGRDPQTGKNYQPALELVRLTIPRRVYTHDHMDALAEGIIAIYKKRDKIKGLQFIYEPPKLRFFQGRFEEVS